MTGGTVNVGGSTDPIGGETGWANKYSYITGGWALNGTENPGNAAVSLTGGTVNLYENGRIQTTYGETDPDDLHMFHVGGNVVINMDGDGAMLRAGADTATGPTAATSSNLFIDGGTINVKQDGAWILSRETEIAGGIINVTGGSSLKIASASDKTATDIDAGLANNNDGSFHMSGGTINNAGFINLLENGAGMDFTASGGSITGTLTIDGATSSTGTGFLSDNLHVTGGSFQVENLTLASTATGGTVTLDGNLVVTGNLDVSGAATGSFSINSSGSLTADAQDLAAAITAGELQSALNNNTGTIYANNAALLTGSQLTNLLSLGNVLAQDVTVAGDDYFTLTGSGSTLTRGKAIQNLPTRTHINANSRAPLTGVVFNSIVGAGGFDFYIPSGIDRNGLALTFNEAATLSGLGGVLVTANGYEYAPDVTAEKNLTLGNPNNRSGTQGGKLGTVTMAGTGSAFSLNINNGSFAIEKLNLTGNSMTIDNAVATVNHFTLGIDGRIAVKKDSILALGTNNASGLENSISALKRTPDGAQFLNSVNSTLAIFNPMDLDGTGGITVGSGTAAGANEARFGADSLFIVDASKTSFAPPAAALTARSGTGAATIDANAKLYIYNARKGTVNVLDGFSGIANNATGWTGDNFSTDTPMLELARDNWGMITGNFNSTTGDVILAAQNAAAVYGNTPAAGVINALYQSGRNDVNSGDPGVAFLSRATSYLHNGPDTGRHLLALEGAANIASVAGAPSQSLSLTRMNTTAVRERFAFSTGFAQDASASTGAASDTAFANVLRSASSLAHGRLALWVKPVYQHTRVSGLPVGAYSNKLRGNMGGASLGADFTAGDNFRFGLATHFGGGKTKTENPALPATETSFAYGGLGLFAGWSSFDWSVLADTGYTYSNNDVTQNNPVASLSADPDTHAWNIGLTAEHRLSAGLVDIIPHAGVRYEGIYTERHTVAGAGMDVDGDTLHFATIPLGVRIGKAFISGKWTFSPYADLGALLTFGDRHATSSYTIAGIRGYGSRARTADTFAFDGKLGMQFENGRFFGGADYSLLKSKDTSTHTLSATFGVNF